MKSVSGKAFCKIIERHGWSLKRITGSHHIYTREGFDCILSVPAHGSRDLPTGLLRKLLKDAELTESDF